MNPTVAGFQTIFAAVRARRNRFDRIEMRAFLCHFLQPLSIFYLSIIVGRRHYKFYDDGEFNIVKFVTEKAAEQSAMRIFRAEYLC